MAFPTPQLDMKTKDWKNLMTKRDKGNHYANQCDQKKETEERKDKKDAHLHLTTSDAINPHYNDDDADYNYGGWGSVTVDGLMFHQTGKMNVMCYRDAVLKPHKTPKRGKARTTGKWAAATEHLMQQTGTKGKINPNW
eukprot:1459238-Ditylum_brightwellii.AAC.1